MRCCDAIDAKTLSSCYVLPKMWVSGKVQPLLVLFMAQVSDPMIVPGAETTRTMVPRILTRKRKPPMKRPLSGIAAGYGYLVRMMG